MTIIEQEQPAITERRTMYVGALDGLRALAVAAVIVYHFAPRVLPAGFLGVDVFFVVSGFLIARLLVRELGASGALRAGNFWSRRARRLLPAVGTMTVVICIAAALKFNANEIHDVRAQAIGTLTYVANWVIIAGKGNYFTSVGRPSPFLHMWSLAIEEQFYVVLPIVFLLARRSLMRHPVRAAVIALLAALASTVYMSILVAPRGDPSRAYLGTAPHAMGLLVGVALGILAGTFSEPWERVRRRIQHDAFAGRVATVAGGVALVAVVVTMRLASDHTYSLYRGGFLAFSVVCGVLIVVVVMAERSPLTRALGRGWLVAIGVRSYSLYLWHWPVRVFISPSSGLTGVPLFMVRLAVSVVLAEISYRLIERPLRTGALARRAGSRPAIGYYLICAVATVLLVTTVAAPGAAPITSLAARNAAPRIPGQKLIDMFGDSTGFVLGYQGALNGKTLGIDVRGDPRLGCGLVVDDRVSQGVVIQAPSDCGGWQERWKRSLQNHPDFVMFVNGAWDVLDQQTDRGIVKFGTPAWTQLMTTSARDALTVLTSAGRPVYVFEVPCYGEGDPNAPIPERAGTDRIAALNAIYAQMEKEMPLVHVVHWRALVCPGGKRLEELHGVRLWEPDEVHLSPQGAVEIWKWWLPQVEGGR